MPGTWKLVHLLFTFTFVAALLSAHWNVLAARRTQDWRRRAALLDANLRVIRTFGMVSLVLLGVVGNLVSVSLGYRLASDSWIRWVNVMWLVTLALGLVFDLPATRRLAVAARAGSEGGSTDDFAPAMGRWRLANLLLMASFIGFLSLMVFRWRS